MGVHVATGEEEIVGEPNPEDSTKTTKKLLVVTALSVTSVEVVAPVYASFFCTKVTAIVRYVREAR
jgi:hypothetical protein